MNSYDLTGEKYHQTINDVRLLKRLAWMLPANPVVINIGACFGTSALAMLEERPDIFIFSIDVHPSPLEREHIISARLDIGRVVRCLGRSQDIGQHWPDKVDMVYVDGAHGYQDVVDDILTWRPHVRPGGVMLFHDYDKPICADVKPAIDKMMAGYEFLGRQESMIWFRI